MTKALTMTTDERRYTASRLDIKGWEAMDSGDLKIEMTLKAKQNPRAFIMATKDIRAKVKVQARDVQNLKVIYCDADINSWKWASNIDDQFKKNQTICEFKVDQNPEEVLLEYLLSGTKESNSVYEKFVEIIKNPEDYID